jgi:uncharacterized protein
MKVAITGSSGLIGRNLTESLISDGCTVVALTRTDVKKGCEHLQKCLTGVNVVINLAGAPILKRWSKNHKDEIFNSRVVTTRLLTEAINGMVLPPELFISASAVGIYDEINVHDEFSLHYADNFLAEVCEAWEVEALKVDTQKVRLAMFRFGVVLSSSGGALKQLLLPFKLGLGGKIGNGDQPFPWIHLIDVVKIMKWAIHKNSVSGIYNLVAPEVLSNKDFTKILSFVIKKPTLMPVPVWVLKVIFGRASQVVTGGQQVIPHRLLADGYTFAFPTLLSALKHDLLKK